MFCGNCGKQNPEGAKFCAGCGNALDNPSAQKPAEVRKKTGVVKGMLTTKLTRMLVGVIVFAILYAGSYVIAGRLNKLPDVETSPNVPSSSYSIIYWNCGLGIPESDFAGQDLKTASYVIDHGEDMVENMEFVFEDGEVLVIVDSIYIPVRDLDDVTKAELELMMQTNLASYIRLSCCQYYSYEESGYYVFKLIFSGLDNEENVHQLAGTELFALPEGETQVDVIGIKETEENLLAGGFVKR